MVTQGLHQLGHPAGVAFYRVIHVVEVIDGHLTGTHRVEETDGIRHVPPTKTFDKELTLHVGNHTFQITHLPGHTAPQTAILVPEEGVVFTGDNIFHKCKTFIQEADPWEWLDALRALERMDVDVIAPGHGETCDKSYLSTQAQIIENWLGTVEDFVNKGLTEEEALQQELNVPSLDPYPIGQRLFAMSDRLNGMNVSNIYKHVKARKA